MRNNKEGGFSAITTNPRILAVYGQGSPYANVEYTLPAITEATFESTLVTKDPQIREVVVGNLRTILTPGMYAGLSLDLKAQVKTMSSPFECGRVLEADETVEIDGKTHVVNFKGVGATTIGRNGAVAYRGYLDMRGPMSIYPFYDGFGELAANAAQHELEGVEVFREKGVDTEKVLGIYAINSLVDPSGRYESPHVLRASNYFRSNPVILARASRSNFRLLDSVTMYERRQFPVIPAYREFILDEFQKQEGVSSPDLPSYLRFITGKVVGQELPLIAEGYEMCSGGPAWQNLARNVSTLGEELDLESVGKSINLDSLFPYFDYAKHVGTQLGNIDATVRALADTMSYDGPRVDFEHLADTFWLSAKATIEKMDLGQVMASLPDSLRDHYGITGENRLLSLIYQGIIGRFKGNILSNVYNAPVEGSAKVYQARIVSLIDAEAKGLGVI